MEWMKAIGDSIQYIEAHICEEISMDDLARHIGISPYYYQKGFAMLCDFTVAEYIRNRRLALAGRDVVCTDRKIIDIALQYGYDSPDSFTKAFTRFHGSTPTAVRRDGAALKSFAPLNIKVSLEGGYLMVYRFEEKDAFTVLANAKTFAYEDAKKTIPQFWQAHYASGKGQTVCGQFGINIDEAMTRDSFEYLIADVYEGQPVPEGFVLRTIPALNWAVFPCKGPLPAALQDVNTKIFTEWLPALGEYTFAAGYCVEMYDDPGKYAKGTADENYFCEIWIPVKRKGPADLSPAK